MTKYTACIIGTGRIGFSLGFDKKREQPASHTFSLLKNKRVQLVSACDINKENLKAWSKSVPKAKTFCAVDDLLKEPISDIVVIAVNEAYHKEVALKVIAKKPRLVILEKPVARDKKEAQEIKAYSKKYCVPVMINHERRFALDYNLAKDYIAKIGKLQSIKGNLFSGLRVYAKSAQKTGEYSLFHDGTHLVDMIYFFLESQGYTQRLHSPIFSCIHKDSKDNVRNLCVSYNTPICPLVQIDINGDSKFFDFAIEILGQTGKIKIGNGYQEFYQRQPSKLYSGFFSLTKDKTVKHIKKTLYFSNMVQNAVDFLDGSTPLYSTLDAGVKTLLTLQEIKEKISC